MVVPVTGERLVEVQAVGWGDGHEGLRTNQYHNPFWNTTGFFKTSKGHSSRISVCWHIASGETERAQFYGDRLSYVMERPEHTPNTVVSIGESGKTTLDVNGYPKGDLRVQKFDQPNYWDRLPESMRVKTGHGGSHTFLTHEFISSIVEDRTPAVNVWEAIAYTMPGIIAHQSALRGGEVLKIQDYGTAPALAGCLTSMQHLLAGIGRADITPAPGTPQGGWGAQSKQRSVGADLPLYATALVLAGSGETVAIVDVDASGFDAEWTTNILNAISELTSLPRERIRFSCTHTHSGPNTFRIPLLTEGLDMALGYLRNLPHQIAGAVWQAMQNLVPVRMAASKGSCDINVNRRLRLPDGRVLMARNWEGAVDRTVRVLRFDDLEERPVATIVHYACHPTTMAWQDQHVTPDYPGMAKRVVEEQVGGTCVFLQG